VLTSETEKLTKRGDMYLQYYNLKEKPFGISPDHRYLWLSEKHSEALATLKYGILDHKGFLLLTGDVGTGKTVLLNRLMAEVEASTRVASITDPGLNIPDFFRLLAAEFNMGQKFGSKGEFLIRFKNFLHQAYTAKNQLLLIIDEAQRMRPELLEEIRLLSNIELHHRKLINIFFVGQNEFNDMLMEDRNRAVRQRIALKFNIDPLTENETQYYIGHRLKIAGATGKIFTPEAIHEIFSFTGGYPRLINITCDHALLTGYAAGLKSIDQHVIQECKNEIAIKPEVSADKGAIHERVILFENQELPAHIEPEKSWIEKKKVAIASLLVVMLVLACGAYFIPHELIKEDSPAPVNEIMPQESPEASPEKSHSADNANENVIGKNGVQPAAQAHFSLQEEGHRSPQQQVEKKFQKQAVVAGIVTSEPEAPIAGPTPIIEPSKIPLTELSEKPLTEPDGKPFAEPSEKPPPKPSDKPLTEPSEKPFAEPNEKPLTAAIEKKNIVIYFRYNSNEVLSHELEKIDHMAKLLSDHPQTKIFIEGFTDSRGNYDSNKKLSEIRANVVKKHFVAKGISAARIDVYGRGQNFPIKSNDTAEGRKLNRRVEVKLITADVN
jgi:general secretion pathway protein A